MKINEIEESIPAERMTRKIPPVSFTDKNKVGEIESKNDVMLNVNAISDTNLITYFLMDANNQTPIAYVTLEKNLTNNKFHMIKNVISVKPGSGAAPALYYFLVKKLDIPLISDTISTEEGIKLWKRLFKIHQLNINIYDRKTGEKFNLNSDGTLPDLHTSDEVEVIAPENDVNAETHQRFFYIAEQKQYTKDFIDRSSANFLVEHRFFEPLE